MIDHVSVSVSDLGASTAFYEKLLGAIGMTKLHTSEETSGFGKKYPEFWLNPRPGFKPGDGHTGMHICFRAPSVDMVKAFHEAALEAGGRDDGAPGPRPEYHETYYAAFVVDPDGNRIEVVTYLRD